MRNRFRRSKRADSPDLDAPIDTPQSDEDAEPVDFDDLLARHLDLPDPDPHQELGFGSEPELDVDLDVDVDVDPDVDVDLELEPDPDPDPDRGSSAGDGGDDRESLWDRFDRAVAEADLAAVPPAAVVAVVGPLPAALGAVRRCRDRHWMGDCEVFVLTQLDEVPGQPDWTVVSQPSELVAILDESTSDFPLLVLDVPHDLPAFVRPLVARLRQSGVGLVHYVLDDDPDDEDLATWYGELGQPSVLDLASPVEPHRVLELFDRGDPVVSVAGRDLSPELLLALRVDSGGLDREASDRPI